MENRSVYDRIGETIVSCDSQTMDIKGFTRPIFSLGGMIETKRLSTPSIADCSSASYQYTLRAPDITMGQIEVGGGESGYTVDCKTAFPNEWNRESSRTCQNSAIPKPRYTCISQNEGYTGTTPLTIPQVKLAYKEKPCYS